MYGKRFTPPGESPTRADSTAGAGTPPAPRLGSAPGRRRPVRHSGSVWQASVRNPASGAVALRSEVTDSAGDRSVETVYRAYAIG
ncbi:hypothetical protein ACFXDH_13210 [Streptomyces sp. NPDC059467]|uniref:hypothetical protein n=1 Tax=Streptomyces sp. NPDC059467 TaxID=3346844 RepID=UPI00367E4647